MPRARKKVSFRRARLLSICFLRNLCAPDGRFNQKNSRRRGGASAAAANRRRGGTARALQGVPESRDAPVENRTSQRRGRARDLSGAGGDARRALEASLGGG